MEPNSIELKFLEVDTLFYNEDNLSYLIKIYRFYVTRVNKNVIANNKLYKISVPFLFFCYV